MGFLLAVKDFNPTVGESAILALFGVAAVFVVLLILVGCLTLFKLFFKVKIKPHSLAKTEVQSVEEQSEIEEETVAAIIAAISMMYESERTVVPPFKIKNIKLK